MDLPLDRHDVDAIHAGIFDLNAKLALVAQDIGAIRRLFEENDDEEEEEDH
ncbi:MAG: hypothetical protein ACRDNX_08895 [Gaiellaceae bacterium]